ncbi:hypothetical protein HHX47_DHR2001097 [Lentinula edodes]|nr:hypothetical protein HHX47_DHR2001097 [Lentinula edodes]
MPPRFRPIGRSKPLPENHLFLCQCEWCQAQGSVVTAEGEVKGQFFHSKLELDDHHRFQGNMRRMMANCAPSPDFSPPTPASAAVPMTTTIDSLSDRLSAISIPTAFASPELAIPLPPMESQSAERESADPDSQLLVVEQLRSQLSQIQNRWEPTVTQFNVEFTGTFQELSIDSVDSLLSPSSVNSPLRGYIEWLNASLAYVQLIPRFESAGGRNLVKILQRMLSAEMATVKQKLEAEWARQQQAARGHRQIISVSTVLHLICNVTLFPGMKFYLGSMRVACGLHGRNVEEIEAFIPKDPRTAMRRLDLEPQYTSYVCCSRCFKLYPMESFPIHCDNSTFPNSQPCNRRLHAREKPIEKSSKTKSRRKEHPVPNRTYSYQSLNHWIGWMHNRKELGQYLDRPYKKPDNPDRTVTDLWDSDFLGEFIGPDGKNLFVSPDDTNESRLLFNLNADGFNPFGNRTAGKKVTVWGIYMVCINLPPSLRYKPENVFLVGVVPGPKEPTFDQISFILTPLLDDLEALWETGIFLNRTRRHPLGRSVRAALIALEPSPDEKIRAQQVFRHGTQSALNKLLTCSIRYLAKGEELDYRRNKKALVQRLLELVSPVQKDKDRVEKGWFDLNQKPLSTMVGSDQTEHNLLITEANLPNPVEPSVNTRSEVELSLAYQNLDKSNELDMVREVYRSGHQKKAFDSFSREIIQQLARELGLELKTKLGKPVTGKGVLIKAIWDKVRHYQHLLISH